MASRFAIFFVLTIATLLLCGCSSFNRAWKQAGRQTPALDSIEGRWEGHWLSAKNGHNGNLRCLVTKSAEGHCSARFRATYMKILRFGYTIPLEVTRSNDVWYFRSEADLGKMAGGIYQYEGSSTTTRFHSTYSSPYDHGDFEMTRPAHDVPQSTSTPAN